MKAAAVVLCCVFSAYVCSGQEHGTLGGPIFSKDPSTFLTKKKSVVIPDISDAFKFDSVIDSVQYNGHYQGKISLLVLRRDAIDRFKFAIVARQDFEVKKKEVGLPGELNGLNIEVKTGDVIGLYSKKKNLFNFREDSNCNTKKAGYVSWKPASIDVGSELEFSLFRKGARRCRQYPLIVKYKSQTCGPAPMDIYVVVDMSKSIKDPELATARSAVRYLFNHFDISERSTRIGVISYKDTTTPEIALGQYNTREELNAAPLLTRGSLDDQKAGTRTDLAMNMMMDKFVGEVTEGRSQVCILLTDGRSTGSPADMATMIRRLESTDILTVAVGIGKYADMVELASIATGPELENVHLVKNFKGLKSVAQTVVKGACEHGGGEPPMPPPVCDAQPIDLFVVVDISKSISAKELAAEREVVRMILTNINVGSDDKSSRVGLIKYHRFEELEFQLNDHTTREEIDQLDLLTRGPIKGGTRTDLAMNMMMDEFAADDRTGRKQVCILLTDGRATADLTAMVARLQNTDITTFAVGIGLKADEAELRSIATGPDDSNVFIASNFDILKGAVVDIVSSVC